MLTLYHPFVPEKSIKGTFLSRHTNKHKKALTVSAISALHVSQALTGSHLLSAHILIDGNIKFREFSQDIAAAACIKLLRHDHPGFAT